MEKIKKKIIVCSTCAAEYDISLVRCPYCGTAYAPAEENEYMGQLEDIREELEEHKEDGNKSLRSGLGSVVRIIILVAVVVALLLFGTMWLSGMREKSKAERQKEEFLINQGVKTQQERMTDDM